MRESRPNPDADMKRKLYRQLEDKQRELSRCKGQVDRAIMLDLHRSFHAVADMLLSKAGAHVVVCIANALDNEENVTADDVSRFAEIVKKSLPVELHRKWGLRWKDETRLALQSDIYLPGALPLKDWGII